MKFIMSVGEEYKFWKRGREYQGCVEEYKEGNGKQYPHSLYIMVVGRDEDPKFFFPGSGSAEEKKIRIRIRLQIRP